MAEKNVDPDALAEKAFFLTMICVALYGGAVTVYVLNHQASTGVPETDRAIHAAHESSHAHDGAHVGDSEHAHDRGAQ